jgi:4-hydroxybenzoate polyprenyltransferase
VGLSNDWLDAERDRAVGRTDKPVASGDLPENAARAAAIVAALLSITLSALLGWPAAVAHLVFLAAGWSYNAWLKGTMLSVLPYVLGCGSLPLGVTLARPEPALASPWVITAGALLGVAAHFSNVLPDLDDDRATGVRGLPHRMGPRVTGILIALSLAGASACVVLGLGTPTVLSLVGLALSIALAAVCAALVVTRPASALVFRLIITGALLTVVLLATAGSRILV